MNKPKFEKTDANTIRIIVEQAKDVSLYQILENEKQLLVNKKDIETRLENIANIKAEAKKLGIVAKEPEKDKNVKK